MGKHKHSKVYVFVFLPVCILLLLYFFTVPDVSKLRKENPRKTAYMEYREKEWQKKGERQRIDQRWISLSLVSPYLIKAVLIAEDDKFWTHEGFDFEAIEKAVRKDLKTKKFKWGGSTLSQQLARNLYLSPEKSLIRKAREAVITWRMERALSKRRILELYLNAVEWGDGIFGAEAASRHYYGKPASELTAQESARLASVLPNPRKYSPTGNQGYVINRSNVIYDIMIRRGIVVPEYLEVTEEPRTMKPDLTGSNSHQRP